MSNIDEVKKREEEAGELSDFEIWYSVISKFVLMDTMPAQMRLDMIIQTIGEEMDMVKDLLRKYLDDDEIDNAMVEEIIGLLE